MSFFMKSLKYLLVGLGSAWLIICGCSESTDHGRYAQGPFINPLPNRAAALLILINDLRTGAGQPALTRDNSIDVVVRDYAEFCAYYWRANGMIEFTSSFDHLTPADRLTAGGVTYTACDETGWMDMATTNENEAIMYLDPAKLTSPSFSRVGISVLWFP